MANKDANFVGIIALKDTALDQPGIVRLGPPPGNAGILIRGGAGWVFDRPKSREIRDPRIIPQDFKPTYDEVAFALAREMAWRWLCGRERNTLNVVKGDRRGISKMTRKLVPYTTLEKGFVEQFVGSYPGMPSRFHKITETASTGIGVTGNDCQCIANMRCCAGNCRSCQEGEG